MCKTCVDVLAIVSIWSKYSAICWNVAFFSLFANKGAKRIPALTVSLMLRGHLASAQAHKPRLSPVLCAFALCLNRQRAKRYFTNSSNVGQVGSSGDAEQGERWHQAGYGCNWKSAEMVRERLPVNEQYRQPVGEERQRETMKWKERERLFHSNLSQMCGFFARLGFLPAFEKLVRKNVHRIFLPLNVYVGWT